MSYVAGIIEWILGCTSINFLEFETQAVPKVYDLGKLFIALFLCVREDNRRQGDDAHRVGFRCQSSKDRLLGTVFGKVRYWRGYLYRAGRGYYPLDVELALPLDGFSMLLRSHAAKIATKMSYAQSVGVLTLFLQWSPCQRSVEEMVLGLGKHTHKWFEAAPPARDDGEVLVIQIDSKATPTATEEELKKRRGKRPFNPHPQSQRHRGRGARQRWTSKKRKKKGDKSKNGKMSTIAVMYTLRRSDDGLLEGPINKKVYASYGPKRHAVAIARREADKRGFNPDSGKTVQVVTDGDKDLDNYIKEIFPDAIHTIDIFHVIEYLWDAGGCLYKEGSDELEQWVQAQKDALYDGRPSKIVRELNQRLKVLHTGPGSKNRRDRLKKVRDYIGKRMEKMDYKALRKQDLEISSGVIEGAVNYVIAKRFDSGGMRWIKERSEALLQLRCIDLNNDWDDFISYIHDKTSRQTQEEKRNIFLKSKEAMPLPTYGLNEKN